MRPEMIECWRVWVWILLYPSIGDATRRMCHCCPTLPKVVKGPSILEVRKCKAKLDRMGFKRSGRDKGMIYELIGMAFTSCWFNAPFGRTGCLSFVRRI